MKDISKHHKNQTDVWKGCALFRLHESVTDSWWNEPDFKCTSHCEGASRQQPDPQSSGQAGKFSCDAWLKARYAAQHSSISVKTPKNYVLSRCLVSSERQPWSTISERSFSQQNKIFKPAIMGTRFPLRAPVDFFFQALPKCPEAYQIWIWLDRLEWWAIRALQSLAQI